MVQNDHGESDHLALLVPYHWLVLAGVQLALHEEEVVCSLEFLDDVICLCMQHYLLTGILYPELHLIVHLMLI